MNKDKGNIKNRTARATLPLLGFIGLLISLISGFESLMDIIIGALFSMIVIVSWWLNYRMGNEADSFSDQMLEILKGIKHKQFSYLEEAGTSTQNVKVFNETVHYFSDLQSEISNLSKGNFKQKNYKFNESISICKMVSKKEYELLSLYDALADCQNKYEKLIIHLENEYIFYSLSEKGNLLFVSPSVKGILGYDISEYRKIRNDIYTDNPLNKEANKKSRKSLTDKKQVHFICEIYDSTKTPRILEVSEVPVFNEKQQLVTIEGMARDITEKQRSEELMKEQEEKYRLLFKFASDMIIMYQVDLENMEAGNIVEANYYTLKKLGYDHGELRGMTIYDLLENNTADEKKGDHNYINANAVYERVWKSKSGELFYVEISSHNFQMRNKDFVIAVARDISDRKKSEEEIKFINEELINQKENLEAIVDNLTQTQEQLVHSEKMAALGQLISGIAHEINTPLGAIKASIGNLSDSLKHALQELPSLFEYKSKENIDLFIFLLQLATKAKFVELSSREKRMIRKDITARLQEKGLDNARQFAELLIYLNMHTIVDDITEKIKVPNAYDVLRSVRNFMSLHKNTGTINIAVEKATKVVFALKKYAHKDAMGEKNSTDIVDSIETVLTLYHNQLKQGIEVVKKYGKIPLVNCYQDEISQVWTNLIQNAIHAMKQDGKLIIEVIQENENIKVKFKDNGMGVEPDLREKIFEPFFTTKKQGEGSGLGLDIVKRIVEKHEGSIELISQLGEGAEFIITLPIGILNGASEKE